MPVSEHESYLCNDNVLVLFMLYNFHKVKNEVNESIVYIQKLTKDKKT